MSDVYVGYFFHVRMVVISLRSFCELRRSRPEAPNLEALKLGLWQFILMCQGTKLSVKTMDPLLFYKFKAAFTAALNYIQNGRLWVQVRHNPANLHQVFQHDA